MEISCIERNKRNPLILNAIKENIILIGFMGSAKTTVGKSLSRNLKMNFIDTDEVIEKNEGMNIHKLFEEKGESYFRNLEHELLIHSNFQNTIISTGGGMPCFGENIKLLNAIGKTIYLYATPKELARRLENSRKERPLLKSLKGNDLVKYIEDKLEERNFFYEQAQIQLDTTLFSQKEIGDKIVRLI